MKELRLALRQTVPVLCGYIFLGIAFGILLNQAGFNWGWAFFISLFVYAGSLQFVLVGFLSGGASLLSAAFTALSVNSRHIFYGISFIDKFREMGKLRPYMIFSLTDETYSLLCGTKVPEGLDWKRVFFFMALIDHIYWITGSVIGALAGEIIPFDTTGIDFAMTALFTVILTEQWLSSEDHLPAWIGIAGGILCLVLLGPDRFLLPSLILSAAAILFSRQFEKKGGVA